MSEFKGIDKQIKKLQNSYLSDFGKELLTELQRIKKEHSEMLQDLIDIVWLIDMGATSEELHERIEKSKQLIKEATEL